MGEPVSFTVPGRAQPAGSKRAFVNRKTGKMIVTDANPNAAGWKERVALVAAEAFGNRPLLDCPLGLRVSVMFTRPRSHLKPSGELNKKGLSSPYPLGPPDVLKAGRAVEDALQGVVFVNDSRIVQEELLKFWGERDEVYVEIWEV